MWVLFLFLFSHSLQAKNSCHRDDSISSTVAPILRSPKAPECQPPAIGKFKDINISGENSFSGVEHNYRLKRVADKEFEVIFNLEFIVNGSTQMESPSEVSPRKKEINECLKKADGKVIGPKGEKLKFRVLNEATRNRERPYNNIFIFSAGRQTAQLWTEGMSCALIFHELMHLAGLVDEYPETSFKQNEKIAYDCRKIYDKNTLMQNHEEAWTNAMDQWSVRLDLCKCQQADGCKSNPLTKLIYPDQCPSGFQKSGDHMETNVPDNTKETLVAEKPVNLDLSPPLPVGAGKDLPVTFSITKRKPGEMKLLEDRHFNAIVYPGCFDKNTTYYEESANAYRTSKNHLGEGCKDLSWLKK